MNCKVLFGAFFVLVLLFGCDARSEKPEGIYQTTSYNTGKKVLFDFKESGEVHVQVSHVNVSDKMVDDTFFPFDWTGATVSNVYPNCLPISLSV